MNAIDALQAAKDNPGKIGARVHPKYGHCWALDVVVYFPESDGFRTRHWNERSQMFEPMDDGEGTEVESPDEAYYLEHILLEWEIVELN